MSFRPSCGRLAVILAFMLCGVVAQAQPLVDNLAQPTRGTSELNSFFWAAQSFRTADGALSLQAIEALLSRSAQTGAGTEFIAELHADGPGIIGARLASFSFGSPPGTAPGAVTLLPTAPLQLDAHTTYWLVLGERSGSLDTEFLGWSYANGNASSGPGSLGAFGYSTDGGLSWSASSFDTPNPFQLAVHGLAPVPEPAPALLLLPGLLGVLSLWRRRVRPAQAR